MYDLYVRTDIPGIAADALHTPPPRSTYSPCEPCLEFMSPISRMSHRWPIASSYTPVNKLSHEDTRSCQVNTAKILTVHIDGYMRRTRQRVLGYCSHISVR